MDGVSSSNSGPSTDNQTTGARNVIEIDACLLSSSLAKEKSVEQALLQLFSTNSGLFIETPGQFDVNRLPESIAKHLQSISVAFDEQSVTLPICIAVEKYDLDIFVYRLQEEEAVEEENENGELSNFQVLGLPHKTLDGLWEALVYSDAIKTNLLNYVYTAMLYSQRRVNPHIVGWNRVVLLHGPPGTGKTSLCKALAHKLSLRLRRQFSAYDLIEINAHSLFSKWFSESGKLVMKMFASIRELASDPQRFVCILIDEVESLTAARAKAMQGSEPSDAIRVVNAVLTELDKIKALPNVLVMTTSNITGAIDEAFLDRADIVQYIGPPDVQARYEILAQCLNELTTKHLIASPHTNCPIIPKFQDVIACIHSNSQPLTGEGKEFEANLSAIVSETIASFKPSIERDEKVHRMVGLNERQRDETPASLKLLESALRLSGLSGRALRKIPFVAASVVLQGSADADPFRFAEAIGVAGLQFSTRSTSH